LPQNGIRCRDGAADDLFFLLPLLAGFTCNLASAFTNIYSRMWGERAGSILTILLRDVFGIPVWGTGFALAAPTPSEALFPETVVTTILGWVLVAIGGVIILAALATLRIQAAAPTARDSLAETGLYARLRHPIHSGTLLEFLGLILIRPGVSLALACTLGFIRILLQTRFEEWDLLRRIPGYREYMNSIPRFIPRLTFQTACERSIPLADAAKR
jgi:protein-S-isoprenylcysteine O-methyltransferase Ste14